MKKIILFAFVLIISLSTFAFTPDSKSRSENPAAPDKKENKMSEKDINRLSRRAEELRDKDKSPQTLVVQDGRRHRRDRGDMDRDGRRGGSAYFIGGGGLLLLIILIIILV